MDTCASFPVDLREAAIIAEENKFKFKKKKRKRQHHSFSLSPCTHPPNTLFGNPYKLERTTK